ncbi:uncharacterized protein LOC129591496 [Paramacrobiotus metropolitanus]|uniref:uncharacterized protein LOC129591496 n=1 Tax=Paramacrobiotus metropolitanus TaxID=2943436 RepID=UPI0024462AD3|nr:uncharacterized protein LOC129591496 [Paramacrobiotus metropolitanus]
MVRGKVMDPDLVKAVFRLYRREGTCRKVAEIFDKSHVWANKILHNYDEQTGKPKIVKPKGRPRKTTAAQDQGTIAFMQQNPQLSTAEVASTVQIAPRTLQRRLKEQIKKKKEQKLPKKAHRDPAVGESPQPTLPGPPTMANEEWSS